MSITFRRWQKNGLDRFYVNGLTTIGKAWLQAARDGSISIEFDSMMRQAHRSSLTAYATMVLAALAERGIDAATATYADLVAAYEAATTQEVAV